MSDTFTLQLDKLEWGTNIKPTKDEKMALFHRLSGLSNIETSGVMQKPNKTIETWCENARKKLHTIGFEDRGFPFLYLDLLIRKVLLDPNIPESEIPDPSPITEKERVVLILHMLGYQTKEMTEFLKHYKHANQANAQATVEKHIENLKTKLSVAAHLRQTILSRRALQSGVVTLDQLKLANQWRLEKKNPLTGEELN